MGSVSSMGMIWMIMMGIIAICTAYFSGLLWQTTVKPHILKNRRISYRPLLRFNRGGRASRLKRFERIARDVISDIESALQPPHCNQHARSFLPILSDVKRRGQLLLGQQTGAHRVGSPERERELTRLVDQLSRLEMRLKALPKPNVTVEEVLLGKFE
jgi:hypothetical protein